jgi:hypothetical protein
MVSSVGEGFDRAEWTGASSMMHGAAALAIFLIIDIEPDGVRLS